MKTSELILLLQQFLQVEGDLDVTCFDGETMNHYPIKEIGLSQGFITPDHIVIYSIPEPPQFPGS